MIRDIREGFSELLDYGGTLAKLHIFSLKDFYKFCKAMEERGRLGV